MTAPGRVFLVGAGPGDPELLTLKALRAIRAADVLLVDDLVGDDLLDTALQGLQPRPRVVHVGKRGGCPSTPQAFIERLMIAQARRGLTVVRLKGGDPFVFGRGGEEVQALRAAGIAVEVVNGITSGLAAATALGVPLTHRAHAHGVVLVTGHGRDGAPPVDAAALGVLARQGLTLVVYMGVAQAARLREGLLQVLPARTPVAVVQHATRRQQRQVVTTLGDLTDALRRERLGSPAIIIVGEVLRGLAAHAAAAGSAGDDAQPAQARHG